MTLEKLTEYLKEMAPEVAWNCNFREEQDCVAWDSKCDMDGCAIIFEAIDRLKAPQWISVKDRLPENGWYIVYAPTYRGGSSSALDNINGVMFSKMRGGKWSIEHGYYSRPGCVTHWMPLPEPPKEGADYATD